ncbi:hypothetical protein AMTRI_Chr13g85660 [Amborella trichopoda]
MKNSELLLGKTMYGNGFNACITKLIIFFIFAIDYAKTTQRPYFFLVLPPVWHFQSQPCRESHKCLAISIGKVLFGATNTEQPHCLVFRISDSSNYEKFLLL